jgi:hypothetical protein
VPKETITVGQGGGFLSGFTWGKALLLAAAGYVGLRLYETYPVLAHVGQLLPEGALAQPVYSTTRPGPCQQVVATITVRNTTLLQKNYVLYGYTIPGTGSDPSQADGHFWPNLAAGVREGEAYSGYQFGLGGLQSTNVQLATAGWAAPGPHTVLWQLYVQGANAPTATLLQTGVIIPTFSRRPAHCPPWF